MKRSLRNIFLTAILGLGIFFTTTAFRSDFFEIAKQIEIFTTLFKEINMNYVDETNPAELTEAAITGMLKELDPYTHFWSEQEVEEARILNAGSYTGIGAFIKAKKDNITIIEVYKNSAADKAGLKAGDEILKIGNIAVSEFEEDAGELLKGAPNSTVELEFRRQNETKTTTLKRGEVEVNAVPFSQLLEDNIGYIVLSKFNRQASKETKDALEDLKEQGAEKIILDLRGNPGGLLNEAINVSNLFLPKGELITTTKSVIEKYNKTYHTKNEPVDTEIPLVVLVDEKSASASEIVAGSLQDLDRAVIVGNRSFGKGLVQRPKKLPYGTQLKVTISRYYTPSGRCIQALDYWHRDENGNAIKKSKEEYNEFRTKNGRVVYDGGGILPDVVVTDSKNKKITNALQDAEMIFDFATEYYYNNQLQNVNAFEFTDTDYQDFKRFLKNKNFSFTTETEEKLKVAIETAKKEGFDASIQESYQELLSKIAEEKENALNEEKSAIIALLSDEIVKRYFYQEGLYDYHIQNSPDILESKKILNNTNRYQNILN